MWSTTANVSSGLRAGMPRRLSPSKARGLGWYVMHTSGVYDITGSITALVVLMLLAMVFNGMLAWVERRMLHWRRGGESWTGQ